MAKANTTSLQRMARLFIRTLQVMSVFAIAMIILDMAESGSVPPPVPIDKEGHTASCWDSFSCAAQ